MKFKTKKLIIWKLVCKLLVQFFKKKREIFPKSLNLNIWITFDFQVGIDFSWVKSLKKAAFNHGPQNIQKALNSRNFDEKV